MKRPDVHRLEHFNLAGEYVKGKDKNDSQTFRDLDDYVKCVESIARLARTFVASPEAKPVDDLDYIFKEMTDGLTEEERRERDLRRDFEALCSDAEGKR